MVRLSHDGRKSGLALAVHTGGAAPPEARVAFSSKHMSTAFCPDTILQPMILTFLPVSLTTRARAFTPGLTTIAEASRTMI